jgi:SAM-dependent methyltransferase
MPPPHLAVIGFLQTEIDARALRAAFEFGLIDALTAAPASLAEWSRRISPRGLALVADMLEANGVVAREGDLLRLTPAFRDILPFRDLLEMRIAFADLVWPDIHGLFPALLNDIPQFMARSKTFDLFRYDRCFELTLANRVAAEAWTRFTTCLTRYEADAALDEIDFAGVADVIDLGGNTGEFALAMLRRGAGRATVVDLPVVCAIGRDHVGASTAIAFHPCDMRRDPLPASADLVAFKSVLHDWPDGDARRLLARAYDAVRPGGRLMIFERAPLDFRGRRPPYGLAPDLVFLHFLRPAALYLETLAQLGFVDVERRSVALEVDFHLIVARRPEVKR